MTYYKVVEYNYVKEEEKEILIFYSIIVWGQAKVRYRRNIEAYPPNWLKDNGYGLCVFDSFEVAKLFSRKLDHSQIFECKVTNPRKPKDYCYLSILSEGQMKASPKEVTMANWPEGTIFVDSLTLIGEPLKDMV